MDEEQIYIDHLKVLKELKDFSFKDEDDSFRMKNGEWGLLIASRFLTLDKKTRMKRLAILKKYPLDAILGFTEDDKEQTLKIINAQCDGKQQPWEVWIKTFEAYKKLSHKRNADLQLIFKTFILLERTNYGKKKEEKSEVGNGVDAV
jgi:hypothetical protein